MKCKTDLHKKELLNLMHTCGFTWICDVAYLNNKELVATPCNDLNEVWWHSLETEGHGFTQLFKGSVKQLYIKENNGKKDK
jgi:hypothetical protein